jgi:chromosome segregation ATPase
MSSLLRNVAIAAGAGIVVGLCATTTARRVSQKEPEVPATEDFLRIEPLLDRLERIETRLETAEVHRGATSQAHPLAAELTHRIEEQETELQALRSRLEETERRAAAAIEAVESRMRHMRQELPSLVESSVATQLGEFESRIESQVELKVAERIGALERTLADQSASIGALRDRAVDTDANLQRLIAAVERLCEKAPQSSATVLPFEAQLREAAEREPAVEPRVRVIKENEPEARRRFPLARTFAFLLAILLPRLHR